MDAEVAITVMLTVILQNSQEVVPCIHVVAAIKDDVAVQQPVPGSIAVGRVDGELSFDNPGSHSVLRRDNHVPHFEIFRKPELVLADLESVYAVSGSIGAAEDHEQIGRVVSAVPTQGLVAYGAVYPADLDIDGLAGDVFLYQRIVLIQQHGKHVMIVAGAKIAVKDHVITHLPPQESRDVDIQPDLVTPDLKAGNDIGAGVISEIRVNAEDVRPVHDADETVRRAGSLMV